MKKYMIRIDWIDKNGDVKSSDYTKIFDTYEELDWCYDELDSDLAYAHAYALECSLINNNSRISELYEHCLIMCCLNHGFNMHHLNERLKSYEYFELSTVELEVED